LDVGESSTLVLRFPRHDGDHVYRVAKMKADAIKQLNDQISHGTPWERTGVFGPPLNLKQAMREVNTRDFAVVNIGQADDDFGQSR
jgi:hypothetical protein